MPRLRGTTPILNVSNLGESVAWFERLGFAVRWLPGGEAPTEDTGFAAVRSGGVELFLCLDGQGSRGERRPAFPGDDTTDGVWMVWWIESPAAVDELHERAQALGYEVSWPPTDEPWGVREMHLRHPDGHTFRVASGLDGAA